MPRFRLQTYTSTTPATATAATVRSVMLSGGARQALGAPP